MVSYVHVHAHVDALRQARGETYPDAHVAATTNSKLGIGIDQSLQTLSQFTAGLGTEDTTRGKDLSVGPEVLGLVIVDSGVGEEDRIA